jgi:flagellar basal body P-ring formation protein FlgA
MKAMSTSLHLRACFLALFALPAGAGTELESTQPVEQLQQFAEDFLMQRLQAPEKGDVRHFATAGNLDSRLRLQRCASTLQGILPATGTSAARLTIGVRCSTPAWTVYGPVAVETELNVLVMRAAAARNTSPAATDVEVQQRRVPGIATSYLTSTEQLGGRHLKVAVSPGTALTVDLLAADILIRRGQRVTLVATAGGIEVTPRAKPLPMPRPRAGSECRTCRPARSWKVRPNPRTGSG